MTHCNATHIQEFIQPSHNIPDWKQTLFSMLFIAFIKKYEYLANPISELCLVLYLSFLLWYIVILGQELMDNF